MVAPQRIVPNTASTNSVERDLFTILMEPLPPLENVDESDDEVEEEVKCCEECGEECEDEEDRVCYECFGWQTCERCDERFIEPEAEECPRCQLCLNA